MSWHVSSTSAGLAVRSVLSKHRVKFPEEGGQVPQVFLGISTQIPSDSDQMETLFCARDIKPCICWGPLVTFINRPYGSSLSHLLRCLGPKETSASPWISDTLQRSHSSGHTMNNTALPHLLTSPEKYLGFSPEDTNASAFPPFLCSHSHLNQACFQWRQNNF